MGKLLKFQGCNCSFPIREHPNRYKQPLIDFSYSNIQNCYRVWDLYASGLLTGVFQLESNLGKKWAKELKPTSISHLEALVSILRPSCLNAYDENGISLTQKYCDRKNGKSPNTCEFPALEEILKSTYNLMIYQEDAMAIAHHICGFTLTETDSLIRKCIPGDTKFISKSRGWIEINDLLATGYQDDEFLTMDENGNKYWKKIKDIWYVGERKVDSVKSMSGLTIETTRNHQILTNNGWVANCRLNDEDYLVVPNGIDYVGNDGICIDLAFVIIGLIAEGYFIDNNRNNGHFTNFDKTMMDWWVLSFEKVFGCKPKMGENDKVARLSKNQRLYIGQWMKYGKSATKVIPKVMMGMTKESTRKFLSYYFSCEGGKDGHSYSVSSKSSELIQQIQLLLLRFGIIGNICKKLNPEYGWFHYLYVSRREDQLKLYWELTDYWPECKKEDLISIINSKGNNGYSGDFIPKNYIIKIKRQHVGIFNYDSGHIFNNKATRKKIRRLIKKMGDKQWLDFLNGNKRYETINFEIESRKEVDVFDFSMEDENIPFIIANGLIIHNSLGKKDAKLLLSIEDKFINGAKQVGKISVEDAKRIFDWLKAGARYSFNKSHASGYAIRSYNEAYLKTHFPVAFYTSKLKSPRNSKTHEDINDIVYEAKQFGIETGLPDLRDMRPEFYHDGSKIFFGLTDIKSFGQSGFSAVADMVSKCGPQVWSSFFEFAINSSRYLTDSVVKLLIKAGAVDFFGMTRSQMLEEYELVSKLTKTEKINLFRYYDAEKLGIFDTKPEISSNE